MKYLPMADYVERLECRGEVFFLAEDCYDSPEDFRLEILSLGLEEGFILFKLEDFDHEQYLREIIQEWEPTLIPYPGNIP